MKRLLPLVLLLLSGCASSPASSPVPEGDLPTWAPARRNVQPEKEHVYLQALILEVPARGLSEVHTGPLDVGVLNAALETPGSRVLQSPSLVTTRDQPATLFVGENVAGESVGLRLEFKTTGSGQLQGSFSLTDLKADGTPHQAAKATFELKVGARPMLVEIPGQRLVPSGEEVVLQDRVFLIVIEGREE